MFFFFNYQSFIIIAFDTSSEVSKLVLQAFGNGFKNVKNGTNIPGPSENNSGVISAVLKLMGLEGRKIGAIAVNSIVMVSQLVRRAMDKLY